MACETFWIASKITPAGRSELLQLRRLEIRHPPAGPDERIEAFEEHLETLDGPDAAAEVRGATIAPAEDFAPDDLQVTLFQELGPV
ncbi:hypothetical protein [Microbacterium sp.]|uniref:hypothetical protein n=1 Tax=Microbacterium sp. TaxID=51671 RepID=UPI0025DCB816|nr:hypothetical protein [Microbacterium sp.]